MICRTLIWRGFLGRFCDFCYCAWNRGLLPHMSERFYADFWIFVSIIVLACYLICLRGSNADFWISDPRNAFSSLFWLSVWLSVIFPPLFLRLCVTVFFLEYYCCVMECELFRNFRRFDFSRCLTFLRPVIKCAIFRNLLFDFSQCLTFLRLFVHDWSTRCPNFFETFVQGWFTRKKYETALFPSSSTTGHCLNFLDHLLIFALRWCIFEIFCVAVLLIFYTRNF